MINIFKNCEVSKIFIFQLIVCALSSVICFCINVYSGLVALLSLLVMILIYYISTYKRYVKISELAGDVDKILHGDNTINLDSFSEGELAVLHSEIYKMTVRLREQQQKLLNDKVYLADSIADISHQIKTPLTSINLQLQLLSDPNITEERRQQLIRELYGLLSRIDWLIITLLKISKLDAGAIDFNKEKTSLKALIDKSVAALLVPIELKGQQLIINASGEFCGDINWSSEAIANIVKNCMEHTFEGGKIIIEASENALYSQITITDTGTGIKKEDMPHIFERFYKGKDSDDKSFGVGLALSRMIISAQNGTVKAENNLPCGAKFIIRFYKGII
ncbi:MAG: HAMP domain-containing histidine kinase [Ruminococcaceae bacterium]|nr:HAMP domain-containing histidine kinase [Oscillospiraceae bacterium]